MSSKDAVKENVKELNDVLVRILSRIGVIDDKHSQMEALEIVTSAFNLLGEDDKDVHPIHYGYNIKQDSIELSINVPLSIFNEMKERDEEVRRLEISLNDMDNERQKIVDRLNELGWGGFSDGT